MSTPSMGEGQLSGPWTGLFQGSAVKTSVFSPRGRLQIYQINETPSACSKLSVLSDWMRHYLSSDCLISSAGRALWRGSQSLFPSLCFLLACWVQEPIFIWNSGGSFFCYQIHFRCTDESRVIVFQYYIFQILHLRQPYSVSIWKNR